MDTSTSLNTQAFVGRDSSVPFVGREEVTLGTTTSSRKTSPTTTSARRTTSSRMTSNRSMTSRSASGINSSNNGRTVRAVTQAEVTFSPTDIQHRTIKFQSRITRLPSLHSTPEQINVKLENTPQGNIATLTGTVASERERKVIKHLLLLEPGIDKVENKLSVNGN
ncbi:MAG: BON domain-containing protein [Planctomycetaceae bacterium]|nr:BON domain-containing protein [Planctomycetaceae bacterium]